MGGYKKRTKQNFEMISYNLIVKEEAKKEISDAYYWYENKQMGLGERLLDDLDDCFSSLRKNPKQFAKTHKEMRQALLKIFPFAVIYEIEKELIIIYAIFHTSRNPVIWKNR
jgi:plasmid stabilization system protein ParE